MGKPKEIQPVLLDTDYSWGPFGSATKDGYSLSDAGQQSLDIAQGGLNQYVNELISPSYSNNSFVNRQNVLNQNNEAYASVLGNQAMARGARGNATQNILNNLRANQQNSARRAMVDENARIRNIISRLSATEGNYWNQANTMADNLMRRYVTNVARQNEANAQNVANYNAWRDNLFAGTGGAIGTAIGAYFGGGAGAAMGNAAGQQAGGMVGNLMS